MKDLEGFRKSAASHLIKYPDVIDNVRKDLELPGLSVQELEIIKRSKTYRISELDAVRKNARGNWKRQLGSAIFDNMLDLLTIEGVLAEMEQA